MWGVAPHFTNALNRCLVSLGSEVVLSVLGGGAGGGGGARGGGGGGGAVR